MAPTAKRAFARFDSVAPRLLRVVHFYEVSVPQPSPAERPHRRLKSDAPSVSLPHVGPPEAHALSEREHVRPLVVRVRLPRVLGVLVILAIVGAATAVAVDRLSSDTPVAAVALPEPTDHLLPGSAPEPQILALHETLRLFLPVAPDRVSAIGYRGSGANALPLEPFGTLANPGILVRLKNRIFGGGGEQTVRYYLVEGGTGPQTGGVDIGAPIGTNVYAPVDGTILAINPVVISGRRFGHRVDIQPATTPSLVVTVTNIKVAATLEVGHRLTASRSRLGRTIDISGVQTAALAQFTQDKGHHVHMEVVPAANVALP